jgi:hypothetical protein
MNDTDLAPILVQSKRLLAKEAPVDVARISRIPRWNDQDMHSLAKCETTSAC